MAAGGGADEDEDGDGEAVDEGAVALEDADVGVVAREEDAVAVGASPFCALQAVTKKTRKGRGTRAELTMANDRRMARRSLAPSTLSALNRPARAEAFAPTATARGAVLALDRDHRHPGAHADPASRVDSSWWKLRGEVREVRQIEPLPSA